MHRTDSRHGYVATACRRRAPTPRFLRRAVRRTATRRPPAGSARAPAVQLRTGATPARSNNARLALGERIRRSTRAQPATRTIAPHRPRRRDTQPQAATRCRCLASGSMRGVRWRPRSRLARHTQTVRWRHAGNRAVQMARVARPPRGRRDRSRAKPSRIAVAPHALAQREAGRAKGIASSSRAGRSERLRNARRSPGASRHESKVRIATSPSSVDTQTSPASTT